jgi:Flp pilus assembly protein TadG
MKRRPLQWNVFRDDGGQALTEFVIVIPIILLLFFAMLQYFAIVQAAQLGNYAAFVSARVYAVRASIDANDAKDKAETAAALALAPIAGPAVGELTVGGNVPALGGILNALMGNAATKYLTGFAMAKYARFGTLGGSISNSVNGSPKQVDTTINYPQPIFVPGLAGMWNFVTGDKIYYSMKPLRQGLGGLPGTLLPVYETYNQAQQLQQQLAQFNSGIPKLPDLPTVILPYVNIQSKCSVGYADWQKYNGGPRLHATGDESDDSGTTTNQDIGNTAQNLQKAQQDQQNYNNNLAAAGTACQSWCTSKVNLGTAHTKDDPIIQNQGDPPPYTPAQVAAAQQDLNAKTTAEQQANAANQTAQGNLDSARQQYNQDPGVSSSVPGSPCNCP